MRQQEIKHFACLMKLMQADLQHFEAKYGGKFAEAPHAGLGNRKTRCVNEATLPIITCHPSCMRKCARECYVINIMTFPRPSCRRCQARNTVLRRIDAEAYYEYFFAEAERRGLPLRLSDGGDMENATQARACVKAAQRHPSVHAIGYTKRIELLGEFMLAPANLHMRYSAWAGDEANTAKARAMGFDLTHVVTNGGGNCPYQNSMARFRAHKAEIARQLRAQGIDTKTANKQAERLTESEITVHHCRDCARLGIGCCAQGIDIRFNKV
ncbi:MAG: hypothetical protein Q4B68_01880 [Bacteroidales bacterium]|nr:hypothetical protein [Bacteroidales bacterium]